jgi:N4-gp56 family major capsid protein
MFMTPDGDEFYVMAVHPRHANYLRRDPDWQSAQKYAGSRRIFRGELGRFDGVIFMKSTHQGNGRVAATKAGYEAALDGTGQAGQDLFRATLFGDESYAIADSMFVELRNNGVQDYGRFDSLAWIAYWAVGTLEDDYIVHVITS